MSEKYTSWIMVFVLGIVLMAIGIGLATYTRTETTYQNYYGIQIPTQVTVQPYITLGSFIAVVGFGIVLYGLIETSRMKKTAASSATSPASSPIVSPQYLNEMNRPVMTEETTATPCAKCGTLFPLMYHFCPNCGEKRETPS